MAEIVLINPRFETSFWGMENALGFLGKRAALPVAALPLLAALTPEEHHVTIIDENVEPIDFDLCARADIVGVTGMVVQRQRMGEILAELELRDCYIVLGGPWITVSEDYFSGIPDVVFVGEAEETWPQFLADWSQGHAAARYEQAEKTDMTQVPPPRLDLLKIEPVRLRQPAVLPRLPVPMRVLRHHRDLRPPTAAEDARSDLAELDAAAPLQLSDVFIVDDNLIGNKKAIKPLLRVPDRVAEAERISVGVHSPRLASIWRTIRS